jgi:polyphosphate kinase
MNLLDPSYYTNRELSWLEFNERVLEEAYDTANPLLERLKFLAISASNLDEFFMVRVSSLWEQENAGPDLSGRTPREQLKLIAKRVHAMTAKQYNCLTRSLMPALTREGINVRSYKNLNAESKAAMDRYFEHTLFPVLTPMAIDPSRPFPNVNNRTINFFVELSPEGNGKAERFAIVQVPTNSKDASVRRFMPLPEKDGYCLLESVIESHIGRLFEGQTVTDTSLIRVTRNSDLAIDEEEMEDLLEEMEESIKRRRWGDPMRLEIGGATGEAVRFLTEVFELEDDEVYSIAGPPDMSAWMDLVYRYEAFERFGRLRNKPLVPKQSAVFANAENVFDVIKERDVLVHHPYMSFDCVVRFVQEASNDPSVLAIKQTLYRVSGNSPIIEALINAAENGKQVTVVIELKARFDESNNIRWAKKLERAGVHVIYGLMWLKTHCKLCLVVRSEDDGIRRYLHMGTGNYNESTAKLYTDTGYFTCRETFAQDASRLFNVLTGYSVTTDWQKFAVAPESLRAALLRLIDNEAQNAREGQKAEIVAKMNSLADVEIIQALYRASGAGVTVRLLVRGICCLKPGIPGVSDNITVSGIVDRYLEHTRIFYFENGGIYLSSADWMVRNMDRRVEVLFPIEDAELRGELRDMLELSLSDNIKRRVLSPDGSYRKPDRRGRARVQSQPAQYARIISCLTSSDTKMRYIQSFLP